MILPERMVANTSAQLRRLAGLLIVVAIFLGAPRITANKEDWLPVPPEDLALKDNPASPGSHAMILYSETIEDRGKGVCSNYTRIKIFDQEGTKFAAVEVRIPDDTYRLEDLRARTIHPDGSIVIFAASTERRHENSITGPGDFEVFSLPDVSPGSIIEYRYRIEARGPEKRPLAFANYRDLSLAEMFLPNNPSVDVYWTPGQKLFQRQVRLIAILPQIAFLPGGKRGSTLEIKTQNLPAGTQVSLKKDTLTCEASNLPASVELAYPPPARDLQAHVEIFIPGHPPDVSDKFWGVLAYWKGVAEGEFQSPQRFLRRVAEETIRPGDTPDMKLRRLYARAQALRNLDYEPTPSERGTKPGGSGPPVNAEDVLRRGYGTSLQITRVFAALGAAAHFESGTVYVSSRAVQNFDPDRHDPSQLVNTLAWIRVDSGWITLDPGTPFCPFGILPWPKALSGGLVAAKDGWKIFTTRGLAPADTRIARGTRLQLDSQGMLRGSMRVTLTGQEALDLRLRAIGLSEEARTEMLRARVQAWLPAGAGISRLTVAGWSDGEKPLGAELEISIPAPAGPGGRVTLPVFLPGSGDPNPFEGLTRAQPVDFPFPFEETDELRMDLPPNAKVEKLPDRKGATLDLPGLRISGPEDDSDTALRRRHPGEVAMATYQIGARIEANSIVVSRRFWSKVGTVAPEQYPKLRDFYTLCKAADLEAMVLSLPAGASGGSPGASPTPARDFRGAFPAGPAPPPR